MTSAAIYARVSSARQAKDETIGSQLAALVICLSFLPGPGGPGAPLRHEDAVGH